MDKVIIITGATSGIGLAAAKLLAGSQTILLCVGRNDEKCIAAKEDILSKTPGAIVEYFTADLSSQAQVGKLADGIKNYLVKHNLNKVDVLINNAAMVTDLYTATEDGYETQFAVNHLAPFLLTRLLLPELKQAPNGRVLTVSSESHRTAKIRWKDVMMQKRYFIFSAYKQSKLANVMFTFEFNRLFEEHTNIRAYAIDPGLVITSIGTKGTGGLVSLFWNWWSRKGISPEESAETIRFVASENLAKNKRAIYWKNSRPIAPSKYSQREAEWKRLWKLSERLCGIDSGQQV